MVGIESDCLGVILKRSFSITLVGADNTPVVVGIGIGGIELMWV